MLLFVIIVFVVYLFSVAIAVIIIFVIFVIIIFICIVAIIIVLLYEPCNILQSIGHYNFDEIHYSKSELDMFEYV